MTGQMANLAVSLQKEAKKTGRSTEDIENLDQMMRTWTMNQGLPIVEVELLNSTHIELSQTRFIVDSTTPRFE